MRCRPDLANNRSDHLRQWFGEKVPASRWGRPPRYPLDLADGRDLTDIDIAMLIALGIEGRVLSPWEEGMANVAVVAMRPNGLRVTDNAVYSDDLGNYRLHGLAPGRYRVCANPPQLVATDEGPVLPFVQTCHPAATTERAAGDVTLTSSDVSGIDVRLQRTRGRSITGTVVDAQGMPADGSRYWRSPRPVPSSGERNGPRRSVLLYGPRARPLHRQRLDWRPAARRPQPGVARARDGIRGRWT